MEIREIAQKRVSSVRVIKIKKMSRNDGNRIINYKNGRRNVIGEKRSKKNR